jgi:endonuclease/exonuclease/phosphatase family metal-dependent hydrolase
MQLITVNIWGGKVHDPLFDFIKKHKENTDIFFFQEVFRSDCEVITHGSHSNIIKELINALPDFNYYYSPTATNHDTKGKVDFPLEFGQCTFTKKGVNVINEGEVFVHKKFNEIGDYYPDGRVNFPRNFIYSEIEDQGKKFLAINIHGYWEPKPKYDTPERKIQSQKIIDFVKEKNLPAIVGGDFNLRIDTNALKMFEDNGFRNLVKESKALTTRSRYYEIEWRKKDKFADYILVNKGIYVTDFKVMKDEISDHLPLFLKFEI